MKSSSGPLMLAVEATHTVRYPSTSSYGLPQGGFSEVLQFLQ